MQFVCICSLSLSSILWRVTVKEHSVPALSLLSRVLQRHTKLLKLKISVSPSLSKQSSRSITVCKYIITMSLIMQSSYIGHRICFVYMCNRFSIINLSDQHCIYTCRSTCSAYHVIFLSCTDTLKLYLKSINSWFTPVNSKKLLIPSVHIPFDTCMCVCAVGTHRDWTVFSGCGVNRDIKINTAAGSIM